MADEAEIREFWFGREQTDAAIAKSRSALWWEKNAEVDASMRERFEQVVRDVAAGAHRDWLSSPQGALALILLVDQFPRNIFRDTPEAFAFDSLALQFARAMVDAGFDHALRPIECVFCYLPFEHSESIDDQQRAVELFTALHEVVPEENKSLFAEYLDFAIRHRAVIERFGRFPHRNRILGRVSTAEEAEFLQQPNSSF